ncbi:thiamine phosphate synthase [Cesiribacter sp. SM1]|uniref:thiamine phosphate synthase n=1 Tax=Cesiribacter sp. SM1 TaxID=2861196 RepID=UPI001CD267AA|nr:thiamine phosphate synthase [Cesiribacter sp. SM1]
MPDNNASSFRLLVITPERPYALETQWVNRLFANGLETLHLRKKGWSEQELLAYLHKVEERYHPHIMVHYAARMPELVEVKGVHFQQHTLPHVKPGYCVSCPVHSWEEFLALAEQVDYALLSPFFNSISKPGYAAHPQLQQVPANAPLNKVVAMGGIDGSTINTVRQLGIGGAAVLGAIWQAADPLAAFLEIQERVNNA